MEKSKRDKVKLSLIRFRGLLESFLVDINETNEFDDSHNRKCIEIFSEFRKDMRSILGNNYTDYNIVNDILEGYTMEEVTPESFVEFIYQTKLLVEESIGYVDRNEIKKIRGNIVEKFFNIFKRRKRELCEKALTGIKEDVKCELDTLNEMSNSGRKPLQREIIKEYRRKGRYINNEIKKRMKKILGNNYFSYNIVHNIFYKPCYGSSGNQTVDLLSEYESLSNDIDNSLAMIDRNEIRKIEKDIELEKKKEELKEKKINNWKTIIVGIILPTITFFVGLIWGINL